MATTSAFSSNSEDVLERKTDTGAARSGSLDIHKFYELDKCEQFIKDGNFKTVALQFPDELLADSGEVTKHLETLTNQNIFILGDTSYGSCCVDEVAAEHSKADCIIHFGRSCLSQTLRLPVLHVFGKFSIDVEDCCQKFKYLFADEKSHVIVFYDTPYFHCADDIFSQLHQTYPNIVLSYLNLPSNTVGVTPPDVQKEDNQVQSDLKKQIINRCNRTFEIMENLNLVDFSLFFIGREGRTLSNLIMNFTQNKFYSYDPVSKVGQFEDNNTNRALMKRFYMIERMKDAEVVGIVIGTLGVANYLDVIKRIKNLLKVNGKRFYTFVVGKLNPAKLGNFLEIDAFVLVSCSENILVDSKEFYKPVVTPFELEIALNLNRDWTTEYRTDFQEILPGSESYVDVKVTDEEVADVSLVTNRIRTLGMTLSNSISANQSTDIQIGSDKSVVEHSAAGEHLSKRSWKGLEQNLGETPVAKATEGQSGIAMKYANEPLEIK